jgi:hypothetical protein
VTDIDYASRVARGIALMDEKWPNWATEIDLDKLDIQDGSRCMTAQYAQRVSEDPDFRWEDGMVLLGLSSNSYEEHGFNADGALDGDAITDEAGYDTLTALWKAEILRRRAQGQDAPAEPEASA